MVLGEIHDQLEIGQTQDIKKHMLLSENYVVEDKFNQS